MSTRGVTSFRFDRTGMPADHLYDLASELLVYPGPEWSDRRIVVFNLEKPCETDPYTARICLTLFDSGKVLLWGEFEDGDRSWIRDNDDIARACMVAHAFCFYQG